MRGRRMRKAKGDTWRTYLQVGDTKGPWMLGHQRMARAPCRSPGEITPPRKSHVQGSGSIPKQRASSIN